MAEKEVKKKERERTLREPSSRIGAITCFTTSELLARVPETSPEDLASAVSDALKKCAKYEKGEDIETCVLDTVRKWEAKLKEVLARV